MNDKVTIRFWRLQEVEIPLQEGKTLEDLKNTIKEIQNDDDTSMFDYEDVFDFDKEEVINEDYSGNTDRFGISVDNKIINDYKTDNCETFLFLDKATSEWNKHLIKHLDEVINNPKYNK